MRYSRNAIYTRVRDAIVAEHSGTYCTSRMVAKPASFPACYIHEIDNFRPQQFTQLDFQDVQCESVYEIQVVSNRKNTSASEAYAIMDTAKAVMNSLYFREFSETNIDTGDTFTLIGRFRRRIGGGDTMPSTN